MLGGRRGTSSLFAMDTRGLLQAYEVMTCPTKGRARWMRPRDRGYLDMLSKCQAGLGWGDSHLQYSRVCSTDYSAQA